LASGLAGVAGVASALAGLLVASFLAFASASLSALGLKLTAIVKGQ
jgi:hypothetical protein